MNTKKSAFFFLCVCVTGAAVLIWYLVDHFGVSGLHQKNMETRVQIKPVQFNIENDTVQIPQRHYRMMKYDVTFDLWNACIEDGGCGGYRPDGQELEEGSAPVINVNYLDTEAFAKWLSQKTGKHFRLPSNEEWEYAARGGSTTIYWWGNKADCRMAYFGKLAKGECGPPTPGSKPVGSYPPNPYGLYDISGNVWQWTTINGSSDRMVQGLRGGSWADASPYLRISFHGSNKLFIHLPIYGFRLVVDE